MLNNEIFFKISFLIFVVFILDAIISSLACIRYGKRKVGIIADNRIDRFLYKYYPDKRIDKKYNNSIFVG